jgi:hypothetical protein
MRYLYGDSSESPLTTNYLAFLRDAVDFGVALLQVDAGLVGGRERRVARQRAAEQAIAAVEEFGRTALELTEPVATGDAPVNRCAAAIAQAATEAVKREATRVRGALSTELAQLDAEMHKLRERCAVALGALLATHDLPGAVETLTVQWNGTAYEARLSQRAAGVDATVALDIPSGSLFAHDLRVEKFADGTEVHAPETAGWLKKEVKMVPHKLGRHHVHQLIVGPSGTVVRLRATPEPGALGFDVTVARQGDVKLERSGPRPDGDLGFATDERDVPGLRSLTEALEEAARALRTSRGALLEATLDGQAFTGHDHPRVLVERLVAAMEPVVREIAAHSLSPRELVLKRLLGGDRREEIFLSRAELQQKLEPLAPALRAVFAPLGLVDDAPVAAAPPPPPPVAGTPRGPARASVPPPVRADTDVPTIVLDPDVSGAVTVDATALAPRDRAEPPVEPMTIAIDAELPPMREATLPPLSPARAARRTVPPPPPRRGGPMAPGSTEALVDAAIRDLEEAE